MKILVTGAAGFIGFHTAQALLDRGDEVVGLDNLNEYYDVRLKLARLDILRRAAGFRFVRRDLADRDRIAELFAAEEFRRVVHLGAQPGVRHSIADPFAYVQSNILGTLTVLEGCRRTAVEHLIFASSSSVYGANARLPFSVRHGAGRPLSLYAATKKSGEMMAHSYASLYGLPVTGLRFFTVFGPFGRPDMAVFRFTRDILEGRPIDLYNHGDHRRDFTYIDDVVHAVVALLDRPPRSGASLHGDARNTSANPTLDPSASAVPDDSATPTLDPSASPVPDDSATPTLDPSASPAPDDSATPAPGVPAGPVPYRLYNVCSGRPEELSRLVELIEAKLGRKAISNPVPMQPGDVHATWGDIAELEAEIGHRPATTLAEGVERFVDWYLDYHGGGAQASRSACAPSP